LKREADGILAWAVQGCLEWQRDGLNSPSIVRHAVESYRTENDEVSEFLERYCVRGPDLEIAVGELYNVYLETCRVNRQYQTLSKIRFGKRMDQLGFEKYEKGKPKTWTWRVG
jgi:putative DNA primase/helicase